MTVLENSLLVIDVLLWSALIVTKAIIPARSSLSQFELKRRSATGDHTAVYELRRDELLPRLLGAKWLAETVLTFSAITLLFTVLRFSVAIALSLALLLISDIISRTGRVQRWASGWYERHEPVILQRVERYSFLRVFSRRLEGSSTRINSKEELVRLIDQAAPNVLSRDDRTMLTAQLAFSTKLVADVMTPRSMIDSVKQDDTIGPLLLDRLHHTGHSRFPVIADDLDHVVGTLYLHDLVGKKTSHTTAAQAMDEAVYYIGAQRDLEHALHAFLHSHHHLFIVVNEYRETVGVVSLEDVLEVLIGRNIVDEFDEFENIRAVAESNPKSNNDPKGKKDI